MDNDGAAQTESLYVWLSIDSEGVEGIIAVPVGGNIMPLVVADRDRAVRLGQAAQIVANARQAPARLVRFERVAGELARYDPA